MLEKKSVILLRDIVAENNDYIKVCLQEDVSVVCMNLQNKNKKYVSFKVLHGNNNKFWLQNESWEYMLNIEDYNKIKQEHQKLDEKNINIQFVPEKTDNHAELIDLAEKEFDKEYKTIALMSETERLENINDNKKRLDVLISQKPGDKEQISEALVDTTRDTVLHNHVALMNAMNLSNDEAKKQTQNLVDSTRDLVKSSTQLVSADIFNDELIQSLVAKSNGTIIQHMIRVYVNGLAFLSYYNKLVSTSHTISKLRISFEKKYKDFYRSLLPNVHPDVITLEKVFLGGMRAIPENDFFNWAVGFLIHDIGKAAAVEYHEGESAYNREIVVEHVKVGYTSIMNKTNYPRDAGLIAGYHHEYYGDPSGYGYFRSYLEQYKKSNPMAGQNSCICFEKESVIDCESLSFFPAKMLEIIDVFDSLTDPNRKYRKAMTPDEAIKMMEEEFILKKPKLDIILFDIFSKFVQEL
ncbi:MAG: metal-dependent phosphohydrolase [Treponema sp.]|nr:metal-dependent phosphohydrolase [Treponema sp.]